MSFNGTKILNDMPSEDVQTFTSPPTRYPSYCIFRNQTLHYVFGSVVILGSLFLEVHEEVIQRRCSTTIFSIVQPIKNIFLEARKCQMAKDD